MPEEGATTRPSPTSTRRSGSIPGGRRAYDDRGGVWVEKGELDKAIADFDEAIRLDPRSARAYANRGVVWRKKSELDKALADFNEAIRLDPRTPSVYARSRPGLGRSRCESTRPSPI